MRKQLRPRVIKPGTRSAATLTLNPVSEAVETVEAAGPLVLEWLDSETLEWGETMLVRTVGNTESVANNGIIDVPPIMEYARLRNAPTDASIKWDLSYDTVPAPGHDTAVAYAALTSVWDDGPVESLDGVLSATAGVIVPLYVVQPVYTDPSPVFIKITAVSLVELSATYNGVNYGPIYLIITGQSYYAS